MIDCLSNPEPFLRQGAALSERAQFGMAPGEIGGMECSGQDIPTEALAAAFPVEERHALLEAVDRPTIVTLEQVDRAERLVRLYVQDGIATRQSEGKGA